MEGAGVGAGVGLGVAVGVDVVVVVVVVDWVGADACLVIFVIDPKLSSGVS